MAKKDKAVASKVTRRLILFALCFATLTGTAAASKTYKYRCPKCKLIQEYGQPGTKKCPNDGRTMIRQN